MPILGGPILDGGPVIDVLAGVSDARGRLLQKHGFPVPHPVAVRVLIDTGSNPTGFASRVFPQLGLTAIGTVPILTPSTLPDAPHEADLYHVSLSLVANGQAHPFGDSTVIVADCWMANEGIEGLIGRDVLARCNFLYLGKERTFTLAFD